MSLSETELKNLISKSVTASIEAELGQYKVPKEQHYQDHLFLTDLRSWMNNIKSSFWKSLVSTLVPALFLLLLIGFVAWIGLKTALWGGK